MNAPFAENALRLYDLGLAPIPCAGDDGKVPGLRTKGWKRRPGPNVLNQLALKFPEQNVGILTGLSRIPVVDVDEARLVAEMLRRFGHTPLIVETPSGTAHLYYRGSAEHCANLRHSEGLPVDIKAVGSFVVVPPSVRPSGPHSGKCYRFLNTDGWDALPKLQPIKPGSPPSKPGAADNAPTKPGRILQGVRNDTLYRLGLREVKTCVTEDALIARLRRINARNCDPPDDDADVVKAARSAWICEQEGRNFVGRGKLLITPDAMFQSLKTVAGGLDGVLLHIELRSAHPPGATFAVSPKAMAAANSLPGWAHVRIRNAREVLIEAGILAVVRRGGAGPRDPALFCFAEDIGDEEANG
jgi:hypothetical protein